MFFEKIFSKFQKKRKVWKWVVASLAGIFLLLFILVKLSLGELNELGLLRSTGFPGGQDYLLIFQNDAERRPTGGFITAYAILRFRGGIPFFEFGNVYDEKLIQKNSTPPDSTIAELLAGDFYPGHGFRDGNFDADFPTAAEELIRLFRLGFPESEFDGVIAIDFTAFENLAKTLAPEITGEAGLFSRIENEVQDIDLHNPDEIQNRKNFLADIAKSLIKKSILSPKKASQSILESLDSKHILFYFRDSKIQEVVKTKNWDGGLSIPSQDLLAVNEGNYGGMKSSRYLTRDIFYDVEFSENSDGELVPVANLKIQLAHRGDAAEPISGFYKSFWRIFTPLGSQKISGQVDRNFDDDSRQVFGKIIKMNPDETREIALEYELPPSVLADGIYRLKIQKQPGSTADFVRVSVKLPSGYLFQHSAFSIQHSESLEIKENLAVYQTLLEKDVELELKILPDTVPPRLAWQEFVGTNLRTIDLRFNEPLDPDSVAAAKFSFADMNYRNHRFDSVEIQRIRFIPPQNIQLDISGVTPECREWYELRFDGVADRHGNILRDQKITVVQWIDEFGNICDAERKL
ncbi:MAG: DUF4012 domain-containing protein [Patescibacteria group bacterium]